MGCVVVEPDVEEDGGRGGAPGDLLVGEADNLGVRDRDELP